MHYRPGHVLFTLGLALSLTLLAACRSPNPSHPPHGAPLRIGVVKASPPLIFRENHRWKGVEAELGRALAGRLGRQAVFVTLTPSKLSDALLNGKVDILMAGIRITEERRVLMDFSTPYLVVGQAALIRPEDLLRYNTKIKIRSARARFGVVEGSAADRLVSGYFNHATRRPFRSATEAVEALRKGEIDLWMGEAPTVWWMAQHQTPPLAIAPVLFAKEEIAWAFRRGSISLREAANQALLDWQQDGTLEMILGRWLPYTQ